MTDMDGRNKGLRRPKVATGLTVEMIVVGMEW